jgi:hypothetical protein
MAGLVFGGSFIVLSALAPSGGFYDLSWHTIDGGGGTSTDGTYEISGTTGQPDPSVLAGGGYELTGGFWSAFDVLPCPTDITDDGVSNINDLLAMLAAWGPCASCPSDVNGDGTVNINDLLLLLGNWGGCP